MNDKRQKKERKRRNAVAVQELLAPTDGRNRWQGDVSFQLGKDPRTKLNLKFSGVRVPVDDLTQIDGVVKLTELARSETGESN